MQATVKDDQSKIRPPREAGFFRTNLGFNTRKGTDMRHVLLLVVVLTLLSSRAFGSTPVETRQISMDQSYSKMIIGKWSENSEGSYGIASFEAGGGYHAWVWESPKKEKLLYAITGKWWIENGKLFNTASQFTPSAPPGFDASAVVIDKIVKITDDSMTLIDDEFNEYTKTRVKEDAAAGAGN